MLERKRGISMERVSFKLPECIESIYWKAAYKLQEAMGKKERPYPSEFLHLASQIIDAIGMDDLTAITAHMKVHSSLRSRHPHYKVFSEKQEIEQAAQNPYLEMDGAPIPHSEKNTETMEIKRGGHMKGDVNRVWDHRRKWMARHPDDPRNERRKKKK